MVISVVMDRVDLAQSQPMAQHSISWLLADHTLEPVYLKGP